ncbi:MAG: UDP-N-acetylmuramoyl-tripeptide--D-alanyl-D-alanine ligase, partial [Spirochaetaceae bacterium]
MTSDVAVPFTLGSAAPVLGTALHPVMSSAAMVTMVGIDSRAMGEGGLFVPLPGRFTDGHAFVKSALDGGALAALVAESQAESVFASIPDDQHSRLLIVDDPLEALHRLARWYLSERGDIQKIAVTGSNGKTTTKECIASILAQEFSVFKTAGNYNSVIGVPLALFGIKDEHAYVVCELAMSEKGEMSKLAALLSPDLAVITNIGTAHIGNLGSQDDIAVEKKAVFSCFSGRQLAFIAEDDAYYDFL